MNIHEYQAKGLLKKFGAPVLAGGVAYTPQEAVEVAQELGGPVWVVKAQIHAGGRGKAGGVKVVKSIEEVEKAAKSLLGHRLVTHQTGPEGKEVHRVYVEDGCRIAKEYYFSLLIDRASGRPAVIASSEGGMDIEEVAATRPDRIVKLVIDPLVGMAPFYQRRIAFGLGMKGEVAKKAMKVFAALYQAFVTLDASLVEINPLVETEDGEVILLDAKMSFDDNALFRHPDIRDLRDESEEDPMEVRAAKFGLNYIRLDGNIGCMVNGAGLAMATMDIIKLKGGEPANFLDVGGGATRERVTEAFKIILSDENVEAILVNIFGGIMRCDVIADGIITAAREVDLQVPLVVRLEGTNVEIGKKMLADSGLAIIPANDLNDAAEKAVTAARGEI